LAWFTIRRSNKQYLLEDTGAVRPAAGGRGAAPGRL